MDAKQFQDIKQRADAYQPVISSDGQGVNELHLISDIRTLIAEVDKMRAALKEYANPDNWRNWELIQGEYRQFGFCWKDLDPWKPANNALKGGE